MVPEEIIAEINNKNRSILHEHGDHQNLTQAQVLALMNVAAMQGFSFGSEAAMSAVKGMLLLRQIQATRA